MTVHVLNQQNTLLNKFISEIRDREIQKDAMRFRRSIRRFTGEKASRRELELLLEAKAATGLPIVSEIMAPRYCELFEEKVDLVQIGARNMQNFDLLKAVGHQDKPVMIKRGMSATYEEWLMSAEYIMAGGNENVILCERGVRTFESYTRNTLDLAAIPVLRTLTHLPIIADPSHATGKYWLVEPLARAAVAAGTDGLQIEVHNDPAHALCDGPQSLKPEVFGPLAEKLLKLHAFMRGLDPAVS